MRFSTALNRRWLFDLLTALALLAAAACGPSGPATTSAAQAATTFASGRPTAAAINAALSPTQSLPATAFASVTRPPAPVGSPAASATPGPTRTPTTCTETQGQFTEVNVPSVILGYDILTRIYLPPCYAGSGKSYPVLYLIHGLNYTEDQWQRLGIGTAADQLIASGDIAPLIIVLPRDRDDPRLDPAFVTDLLPYVDGHYRTLASAGYRAIGGMSRGGGWAIHLGLRYSNLFGRVGADSPAIFYGDEINVLNYIRAASKNGTGPALYLDIGDSDSEPQSAKWLDQMLTFYHLPHQYVVQPGGHDEAYWAAHLDDYLRFYAGVWRPVAPASATPAPAKTSATPASSRASATRTPTPTSEASATSSAAPP